MENKSDTIHIARNCVVAIRYIMKNSRGEVLEDTISRDPVNYVQGSSGIQPSLQAQLEGLRAGDKKTVYLATESGLVSEDFIFQVIVDNVRPASGEEILLGYPVKLAVEKCEGDCECYHHNTV